MRGGIQEGKQIVMFRNLQTLCITPQRYSNATAIRETRKSLNIHRRLKFYLVRNPQKTSLIVHFHRFDDEFWLVSTDKHFYVSL